MKSKNITIIVIDDIASKFYFLSKKQVARKEVNQKWLVFTWKGIFVMCQEAFKDERGKLEANVNVLTFFFFLSTNKNRNKATSGKF